MHISSIINVHVQSKDMKTFLPIVPSQAVRLHDQLVTINRSPFPIKIILTKRDHNLHRILLVSSFYKATIYNVLSLSHDMIYMYMEVMRLQKIILDNLYTTCILLVFIRHHHTIIHTQS